MVGICWSVDCCNACRLEAAELKDVARFWPAVITLWRSGTLVGFVERLEKLLKNPLMALCNPLPAASLKLVWICCAEPRYVSSADCVWVAVLRRKSST